MCPKAASISDARVQCEGFNRHGVRCGATCKKSWGGLGQVLEAFLGDCLWEPWGKSCELSGGYWQLPWGVLLEICEILRRSLSLAGGTSGRLLWQNLGLQSLWGSCPSPVGKFLGDLLGRYV